MKLFFVPLKLPEQFPTVIDLDNCFVELFEDHLIYSCVFKAEEPVNPEDKSLGLKEVDNFFLVTALKKSISGIEMCLTDSQIRWKVIIYVEGFSDDIKLYFKNKSLAIQMRNSLHEWLLKK